MNFKFKDNLDSIVSDDFWYDLFEGGYIQPRELLADKGQIKEVEKAIEILQNFYGDLEDSGLIEWN